MTTPRHQISYKELQGKLKAYKEQGLTEIKLNSKKSVLLAELASIESRLDLQAAPVNSVESTSSITVSEGGVSKASVSEELKEVEEILTAHQDQQQQLPISSSDSVAGSKGQTSNSTWLESLQEKVIWWIEGFRPYSSRFSFTSRLS